MSAPSQPIAPPSKLEPQATSLAGRKTRLATGVLITFAPLLVWGLWDLALGNDFVEKHAWSYGLVPVQLYVWLLIAAGLLQLAAVFILRKSDQKPRDWISVASLVDAGVSIALTVFFWTQISGLIFHGS